MSVVAKRGIGSHHGLFPNWSDEWQTPPAILEALGHFDLDPCASDHQVHPTADTMLTKREHGSGFLVAWQGRVWLNPPYSTKVSAWIERLAEHGDGIAMVYARTETEWFQRLVFGRANALLFLEGRVTFLDKDGRPARHNSGGPSVLAAYGARNAGVLLGCGLKGSFVYLRSHL
jgi:hypothetical protein